MADDLDDLDRRILEILARDGRATFQAIADAVGLRRPSVHERVRKLEARGVVTGYRAVLDPEAVGGAVVAFVALEVVRTGKGEDCMAGCTAVAEALKRHPEVLEFHTVAGGTDALVKVRASDMRGLEDLVMRRISAIPGVGRVQTTVVLSTAFERALAPTARRKARKGAG